MENNTTQRDAFSSRLGIIAAAAGSAIGLGNIWKFPYITGQYGGAAFIIIYLICIALIGMPVMLSEFALGRRAQKNAIGTFKKLAPNTPWFLTGWLGLVAAFVILAFYGVVAGWTMAYVWKSILNQFAGMDAETITNTFVGMITNPVQPIIWQVLFMALTAGIVLGGIKDGIEKYTKILMPLLLVIILILDIRAITLPGGGAGVSFLLAPDFSKLSALAVMQALGHAFFTLSLGMGTMITYGSYISQHENLGTTTMQVTIADTVIALMAGLAIFPAVFAFGIEPSAGPSLVFITLPNVFNQMAGGYFFSILFFFLLAVAALTSSVSILEVVVAYFDEELNMDRVKATIIAATSITIFGAILSLGNTDILGSIQLPFPVSDGIHDMNIFDWAVEFTDRLLPVGGFFIALFVGWGMNKEDFEDEVHHADHGKAAYMTFFWPIIRYLAPIAILIVFLNSVGVFNALGIKLG